MQTANTSMGREQFSRCVVLLGMVVYKSPLLAWFRRQNCLASLFFLFLASTTQGLFDQIDRAKVNQ